MTRNNNHRGRARAFVLEPCSHDVDAVADYGVLAYVFDRGDKRSSIWDDQFRRDVVLALERKGFRPTVDYFVVAGHLVSMTIALSVMQSYYGAIRVLFFHSVDRNYVQRTLGESHDDDYDDYDDDRDNAGDSEAGPRGTPAGTRGGSRPSR